MYFNQITKKILTVSLMAGFLSPSMHIQYNQRGISEIDISFIHTLSAGASAALGGGGAMRMPLGGGMHMPMGRSMSIPKISRPVSIKPMRPVKLPQRPATISLKPAKKPLVKPVQTAAHKPLKKPEQLTPNNGVVRPHRPSHNYHPHHSHHHGHYHHYPYHGWGNYWDWFWASNIVIGAIVSTIPDNECQDVVIDNMNYKECNGVLFEPVYQDDGVQYEVVDIQNSPEGN